MCSCDIGLWWDNLSNSLSFWSRRLPTKKILTSVLVSYFIKAYNLFFLRSKHLLAGLNSESFIKSHVSIQWWRLEVAINCRSNVDKRLFCMFYPLRLCHLPLSSVWLMGRKGVKFQQGSPYWSLWNPYLDQSFVTILQQNAFLIVLEIFTCFSDKFSNFGFWSFMAILCWGLWIL